MTRKVIVVSKSDADEAASLVATEPATTEPEDTEWAKLQGMADAEHEVSHMHPLLIHPASDSSTRKCAFNQGTIVQMMSGLFSGMIQSTLIQTPTSCKMDTGARSASMC